MIGVEARSSMHPALRAALRSGLEQVDRPSPPSSVAAAAWAQFETEATIGRIWGLVFDGLAEGAISLTAEQRAAGAGRFRAALAASLALERRAVEVIDRCSERGIDTRLLKGADTARRAYPQVELRCFGDIDLLVRSADIEAAIELLTSMGASRVYPQVRAGWDRRFSKSVTMRFDDGWELDVHRTLTPGAFGFRIDEQALWSSPEFIELFGTRVAVLPAPVAALHAMYHLSLGGATRLSTLRDVAQWARHPQVRPRAVAEWAEAWGAEAVIDRALRVTAEIVGPLPPEWSADDWSTEISPYDRRMISRYGETGSNALDVVAELPWSQRPAYLLALAWPSRESMAWRSGNRRGFTKRQLSRMGSARTPPANLPR